MIMDSLNAILKRDALALGMCEKWSKEWDRSWNDMEFCERFKSGQDFCIAHDYPALDFIRKYFDGGELSRFGVYVDRLPEGGELRNGTYVFLGECEGSVSVPRWGAVVIYARHCSRLRVTAGDFSRVTVRLYEASEVDVESSESAIVRIRDRRY